MKSRAPGFTPERLTLARELAGLSKKELATLTDLTSAAIVNYESGGRKPSPELLELLSKVLDQPVHFFMLGLPPQRHGTVFFRSLKSTERLARIKAKATMIFLWDAMDYLQKFIEFPPLNFPAVGSLPQSPFEITETMIEAIAQKAREHWNLDEQPVGNIVWLLESSGAIVMRTDLSNEKMEAMSEWRKDDGRPYILLNDTKKNAFRSRADIAHELGHLLIHQHITEEQLEDNETFKLVENQAWQFARHFLLPERAFLKDAYSTSLDVLLSLKPRWKVSVAFMVESLKRYEVLPPEQYLNARRYLVRRNWRTSEPYDADTEPERPLVLQQVIQTLHQSRIQTYEQIAENIGSNPLLLEQIMGLGRGTLSQLTPISIRFVPQRQQIN